MCSARCKAAPAIARTHTPTLSVLPMLQSPDVFDADAESRTLQRNATLLSPPLNSRSYPATQPALSTTRCRATHVVRGLGKRRSRKR